MRCARSGRRHELVEERVAEQPRERVHAHHPGGLDPHRDHGRAHPLRRRGDHRAPRARQRAPRRRRARRRRALGPRAPPPPAAEQPDQRPPPRTQLPARLMASLLVEDLFQAQPLRRRGRPRRRRARGRPAPRASRPPGRPSAAAASAVPTIVAHHVVEEVVGRDLERQPPLPSPPARARDTAHSGRVSELPAERNDEQSWRPSSARVAASSAAASGQRPRPPREALEQRVLAPQQPVRVAPPGRRAPRVEAGGDLLRGAAPGRPAAAAGPAPAAAPRPAAPCRPRARPPARARAPRRRCGPRRAP